MCQVVIRFPTVTVACLAMFWSTAATQELEHGFVTSGKVKIHYVTAGTGPLVVMIHGFPDYWYTWRKQIPELAKHFKVVAIDQRGYNRSDQPAGVENYKLSKLSDDVRHVIRHFGKKKSVLIGHDWGGYVAWTTAMRYPELVDRLVILNAPHPAGLQRELRGNPDQRKNSQYAFDLQKPDAAKQLTADSLAAWVKDSEARKKYVAAFKRSSFESMVNFYKANYPEVPPLQNSSGTPNSFSPSFPTIKCRVLLIHGLEDKALLPEALNDNWKWMEKELTLITVPKAGHFVHQDSPDLITNRISQWLR